MNLQDGEPPKTANSQARAPSPKPASIATAPLEKTPPPTVVAPPTAVDNLANENPEISTTLLNGKRQPNFRIPPPPAKLYHGNDKSHEISQDGKAIFVYRVTASMDLRKRKNRNVNEVLVLKEIFGHIKSVDPMAMLVPVRDQGQETNYISEGVYLPTGKEEILDYLSHSFLRNNWMGHFALRSHYSLWTLKEQPRFRAFLTEASVYLSQTRFHTERCAEVGYIHGSHMAITRRDDLIEVIKKYTNPDTIFNLIPGKRLLVKGKEKVAYTGLFVECPQENYNAVFNEMCAVFASRHEDLQNLKFVPKKPTEKLTIDDLFNYAEDQNKTHHDLRRVTIKGINSTLKLVTMADASKEPQSLRQFFLNARDEKQEPIFLGLEAASYGRAFATYSTEKEPQAKNFISNIQTKLGIFNGESLSEVRKSDEDGYKIPISLSAGPTSKTISAYETYLLENMPTTDRTDKPIAPPANTKRSRRFYSAPAEGNQDGISYKKVLQRNAQGEAPQQAPDSVQAQNNPPPATIIAHQAPITNLPQPESETLRKLRSQIRDTQQQNEAAVANVKTLEEETVKISGLFAGLSSRLTGLENSLTNVVTQSKQTATAINTMTQSIELDRQQRKTEMREFEHKMLTLFTTFNPAPSPCITAAHRPTTRSSAKHNIVSPPPKAIPQQTQEEYLIAGGFQVVKRGRNSPDANNPTKYQCTDEDSLDPQPQLPQTQEDQEHHLGGDAQI